MAPNKRSVKQATRVATEQNGEGSDLAGIKGELFRRQFKKTTMCRFFTAGKCKSGNSCAFAHTAEELHVAPDLTKTSLCTAWLNGDCSKSSKQCQFAHGAQELRMTPLFKTSLPMRTGGAEKASSFLGSTMDTTASTGTSKKGKSKADVDGSSGMSFSLESSFVDTDMNDMDDETRIDFSLEEAPAPIVMKAPRPRTIPLRNKSITKEALAKAAQDNAAPIITPPPPPAAAKKHQKGAAAPTAEKDNNLQKKMHQTGGAAKKTAEEKQNEKRSESAMGWLSATVSYLETANRQDRVNLEQMLKDAEPSVYED